MSKAGKVFRRITRSLVTIPQRIPKIRKQMLIRLLAVSVVLVVGFIYIVYNLVQYQLKDSESYKKQVLAQQNYSSVTLNYKRGDILDCKGSYLATSTKIYNLILEPKNIIDSDKYKLNEGKSNEISYKELTVEALNKYFPFEAGQLEDILKNESSSYYYVAFKDLPYDQVSGYLDYSKTDDGKHIIGVVLEENYQRTYPNKTAACQLIGYTSSGNVGNWGIEQQYNDVLNGNEGRKYSYMNSDGEIESEVHDAMDGNSVVSTIDLNIQNIVDKEIATFMKSVGAKNVSALVMNPNNSEVLAMSNSKVYDLNDPYNEDVLLNTYDEQEIAQMTDKEKLEALEDVWRNVTISDTYEPGSTFKPFTISAALEEGMTHDKDTFYCNGSLKVGDHTIRCHNTDGKIDLEHALAKSCNVSMMTINAKLGAEKFTKYQSIFGFGQYTNIDLPGEASAASLVYSPENIGPTDLATNSFGQGFNCTMIQLASGFCSLINGGNYYEPHVVKEIRNAEGGTVKTVDKKLVKKTVSKATSKLIKKYLKTVVEEGTGTGCQIAGYEIGGKTGTAEKLPRNNGKYLLSFIGYAPYDNPQVVVYVTIDEINLPNQEQTSYAVHIVQKIMKQVLPYMGVIQEKITKEEQEKDIVNVNESGKVVSDSGSDAEKYLKSDVDTTTEETTEEQGQTTGDTGSQQTTQAANDTAVQTTEATTAATPLP